MSLKNKVIAFYLPQYHPIPENNMWFGEGFTEWTNVARAKPLFKGHYQPIIPKDLGFYDLRLPEVRRKQIELAKEAGITAFCYYHYWFGNGKQILERPVIDMLNDKDSDFPFCLCWANESWYKKSWDPNTNYLNQEILLSQEYPGDEDIIKHFYSIIDAFKDSRYLKVNGKLLFMLYNLHNFGSYKRFLEIWQKLAKENGLPAFHFISHTTNVNDLQTESFMNFDANVLSLFKVSLVSENSTIVKRWMNRIKTLISSISGKPLLVFEYSKIINRLTNKICSQSNIYPLIIPNWDHSARRGSSGMIYNNATPELFKKHAIQALELIKHKDDNDKIIFLKSWNEWGEGNYMEPDLKYGKGYINSLREALESYQ